MTRPPSMAPKPGPKRPGFRPPAAREMPQVEVERVDPQTVLQPRAPVQDLVDNMEDMDLSKVPLKALAEKQKQEKEALGPPPELADPVGDPLDVVITDDLVNSIAKKYGVVGDRYFDVEVPVGRMKLPIVVRVPEYEDGMWVLGHLSEKMKNSEDVSLLMTALQREEMTRQLVAARCVRKIDGHYVWDLFKARDAILKVVPTWDGEDYWRIPDFIQGTLAVAVYSYLIRFDPNLMFALADQVEEIHDRERGLTAEAAKDPSRAT